VFGERHLRHLLRSYATSIMGRARTCPWRMRPYRVLLRGQGVFFAAQSSADCSICMCEFDFRQAPRSPA
jgi:hypothetical protein